MVNPLLIVIAVITVAAAVILYILFPRFGPHYTSRQGMFATWKSLPP